MMQLNLPQQQQQQPRDLRNYAHVEGIPSSRHLGLRKDYMSNNNLELETNPIELAR